MVCRHSLATGLYRSTTCGMMSGQDERSLLTASDLIAKEDYGRAFAHFLLALTLNQSIKKREGIEELFVDCLKSWSAELASLQREQDAHWCYEQAGDVWPESGSILHATGQFLFQCGYRSEGLSFLRKACHTCNKPHPDWLWDLQNAASSLVERWHFRMLNDRIRNQSYYDALERAVNRGHKKILDIGSGTGILSMLAVRAGAEHVTACEMNTLMCNLSKLIIEKNDMEANIDVTNVKSTDMDLQSKDDRFTLVVTEIADAGLLGEGIIPTIQHAWEHLLQPRDHTSQRVLGGGLSNQIIPASATVHFQIIESSYIREQHRIIKKDSNQILRTMPGITSSCAPVNFDPDESFSAGDVEPYSSENLSQVPGGWRPLTDPLQVYHFDFCDPKILTDDHLREKNISIPAIRSGHADAVVSWFELHLDSESTVSSSPDSDSCWEQAVYPIHGNQQDAELNVNPGDTVDVTCTCHPTWMSFSVNNVKTAENNANGLNCPSDRLEEHENHCSRTAGQEAEFSEDAPRLSSKEVASTIDNNCTNCHSAWSDEQIDSCSKATEQEAEFGEDAPRISNKEEALPNDNNCTNYHIARSDGHMDSCSEATGQEDAFSKDVLETSSENVAQHDDNNCTNYPDDQLVKHKASCSKTARQEAEFRKDALRISSKDVALLNDAKYLQFIEDSFRLYASNTDNSSDRTLTGRKDTDNKAIILDMTGVGLFILLSESISIPNNHDVHVTSDADRKPFVDKIFKRNEDSLGDFEHITGIGCQKKLNNNVRVVICNLVESSGVLKDNALEDVYMACRRSPSIDVHIIPEVVRIRAVCIESEELRRNTRVTGTGPTMGLDVTLINEYKTSTQLDVCLSKLTHRKLTEHFVAFDLDLGHLGKCKNPMEIFAQEGNVVLYVKDTGRISSVVYWFEMGSGKGNIISTLDEGTHWLQAAFMLDEDALVHRGDKINIRSYLRNDALSFRINLSNND